MTSSMGVGGAGSAKWRCGNSGVVWGGRDFSFEIVEFSREAGFATVTPKSLNL